MNFIFKEVPDCVSKNLVLFSLNFSMDLFINKAQFDAGFSERLKLKDKSVPTILDPMLRHTSVSNCFHYVGIYFRVYNMLHLFKQSVQMRGV